MIELQTPQLYQGNGKILVAERNPDGGLNGFKDVGRVSLVDLLLNEKLKSHVSSQYSEGGRDTMLVQSDGIDLAMTVEHITLENLSLFWDAPYSIEAANIGATEFSVVPGYIYPLPNVNVSDVAVENEAGTVTYELDKNYKLTPETGSIEILADQSSAKVAIVEQVVRVGFSYPEQRVLEYGYRTRKEYCFRFEGLNIAESNTPVVLECYRVGFYVLNQFKVQGSKSSVLTVRGALMRDTFKPEGSQFFREILL